MSLLGNYIFEKNLFEKNRKIIVEQAKENSNLIREKFNSPDSKNFYYIDKNTLVIKSRWFIL